MATLSLSLKYKVFINCKQLFCQIFHVLSENFHIAADMIKMTKIFISHAMARAHRHTHTFQCIADVEHPAIRGLEQGQQS